MKKIDEISLTVAGIGGKLTHDYLDGHALLRRLYAFEPDFKGLENAIEKRKNSTVDRKTLHESLIKQYARIKLHKAVKQHIDLLLSETTFTITTGHQLNLFTGPLYFVYKIASVIRLCQRLKTEHPELDFVPVYWMNSEDHDFAEINHCYPGQDKLSWEVHAEKYGPVGRMPLDGMEKVVQQLSSLMDGKVLSDATLEKMKEAYLTSSSLSQAHRIIVDHLFSSYGLVILDQDDVDLKRSFGSYIKKEIFERPSIGAIEKTNHYLETNGYTPQVFAREINFFYTGDGLRERIIQSDDGFALAGSHKFWSKEELENEINQRPWFFSPNVVTRPLYQETILPNIAYIGGPAEIAYWLQYKSNFDQWEVFFPALLLRDCFLVLSDKTWKRLQTMGLSVSYMLRNPSELINQYVQEHYSDELDVTSEIREEEKIFLSLHERIMRIDPAMHKMLDASKNKVLKEIDKIGVKMKKHLKKREAEVMGHLTQVHHEIYPGGEMQERHANILSYSPRIPSFVKYIIDESDCTNHTLKVIADS